MKVHMPSGLENDIALCGSSHVDNYSRNEEEVTCEECKYTIEEIKRVKFDLVPEKLKLMIKKDSDFNVVKFMKDQHENQKTVVQNMTDLGASDDAAEYAMFIIDRQRKSIERTKCEKLAANPTIEKLEKKIINQRKELAKFNNDHEKLYENRKCTKMKNRFMRIKHTNSKVSKVTINPCDGRVELKIATQYTNKEIGMATKLLMMVSEYKFFDPYTYRGSISIVPTEEGSVMYVNMRTESKIE